VKANASRLRCLRLRNVHHQHSCMLAMTTIVITLIRAILLAPFKKGAVAHKLMGGDSADAGIASLRNEGRAN